MDETHKGGGSCLASQGDSAEAFEFVEDAFDLVAFLVEAPVDRGHNGTVGIGLDLCGCPEVISYKGAQRVGTVRNFQTGSQELEAGR